MLVHKPIVVVEILLIFLIEVVRVFLIVVVYLENSSIFLFQQTNLTIPQTQRLI